MALDIAATDDEGNQWNFDLPEMREKAERLLDAQKPTLLIGSPLCTPFSNLQPINDPRRDPELVAKEKASGRRHLEWCWLSGGVFSPRAPCVRELLVGAVRHPNAAA